MSAKKKIDHEYTDEVVCPHCGYEYDCSHELFGNQNQTEVDCDSCGKRFKAERDFSVTYCTRVPE